jgi:hypothetical protein
VLAEGTEVYRYINTDQALAADGPIFIEIDNRTESMVQAKPENDTCALKLDSWKAGISEDGAGLSIEERNTINAIINTPQLECEQKIQEIVKRVFTTGANPE